MSEAESLMQDYGHYRATGMFHLSGPSEVCAHGVRLLEERDIEILVNDTSFGSSRKPWSGR
jgi:hypothetical protein